MNRWLTPIGPTTTALSPSRPVVAVRGEPRKAGSGDRGFTLIEVLVALVITLVAVEVLTSGVVSSLRVAKDTATWDRAISSAESHLAAISDPSLILGERQGQDGDGFRWRTRVAFLAAASASGTARGGVWGHGTGLYAVSVTLFWQRGRTDHSFELDSARLGPMPGSGP